MRISKLMACILLSLEMQIEEQQKARRERPKEASSENVRENGRLVHFSNTCSNHRLVDLIFPREHRNFISSFSGSQDVTVSRATKKLREWGLIGTLGLQRTSYYGNPKPYHYLTAKGIKLIEIRAKGLNKIALQYREAFIKRSEEIALWRKSKAGKKQEKASKKIIKHAIETAKELDKVIKR